jgi:acetyl esterase/lipase
MTPRRADPGRLPAVVIFHGGAWQRGSRSEMRERVCRRYLSHGFLTVNVEYRPSIGPYRAAFEENHSTARTASSKLSESRPTKSVLNSSIRG